MANPKNKNRVIQPSPSKSLAPPAKNFIKTSFEIIIAAIREIFIAERKSVKKRTKAVKEPSKTGVKEMENGGYICPQ